MKSALLAAAERLVADRGIEALSLRTIATEVGVSHMAPYAHFKNKTELLKAVAAAGFNQLGNNLKNIQQKSNQSNELLLLYGVAYIEFATNNPQIYKLMLRQIHPNQPRTSKSLATEELQPSINETLLREASNKPYLFLRDCFVNNQSDEKTINIQTLGAWSLVHGIASLMISGQISIDKNSSVKQFLATATQGFTP